MKRKSNYYQDQLTIFEDRGHVSKNIHNTDLVDYGILQEASDYRIHVGGLTQRLFVFSTSKAKALVQQILHMKKYKLLPVFSNIGDGTKIKTAEGFAIPLSDFEDLHEVLIPRDIFEKYRIHKNASLGHQGDEAGRLVYVMLEKGKIPLPMIPQEVTNLRLQLKGTDIIVNNKLHLQVKYDHKAGQRRDGGSGNIFLQVRECNPRHQYSAEEKKPRDFKIHWDETGHLVMT